MSITFIRTPRWTKNQSGLRHGSEDGAIRPKDRCLFTTTCVKLVDDAATIMEEMEAERRAATTYDV